MTPWIWFIVMVQPSLGSSVFKWFYKVTDFVCDNAHSCLAHRKHGHLQKQWHTGFCLAWRIGVAYQQGRAPASPSYSVANAQRVNRILSELLYQLLGLIWLSNTHCLFSGQSSSSDSQKSLLSIIDFLLWRDISVTS